jgi:hypothetical protein
MTRIITPQFTKCTKKDAVQELYAVWSSRKRIPFFGRYFTTHRQYSWTGGNLRGIILEQSTYRPELSLDANCPSQTIYLENNMGIVCHGVMPLLHFRYNVYNKLSKYFSESEICALDNVYQTAKEGSLYAELYDSQQWSKNIANVRGLLDRITRESVLEGVTADLVDYESNLTADVVGTKRKVSTFDDYHKNNNEPPRKRQRTTK